MKRKMRASLTVEAALVLPVFVFAALAVLYINQLILYEEKVQWALARAGREASAEYAASEKKITINTVYLTGKMNLYLDGEIPVQMLRSRFDEKTDELFLIAEYSVRIPFPFIIQKKFHFAEQMTTRAFTGVLSRLEQKKDGEDTLVYVTETGTVYHKKRTCTYLKPSVSQVKYKDLEYLRSEDGGKYYACEGCCKNVRYKDESNIFICNYGNRFHEIKSCRKIKREVQELPLSQAGNRLPCSKCGKE